MPRRRATVATPLDYLSRAADVHAAADAGLAADGAFPTPSPEEQTTPPLLGVGDAADDDDDEDEE